jgi:hypothetical protein
VSNQATFWVWEFSEATGLNRLVLLILAHRHNLEKKGCWPSYRTIATDCRISEATAKRAVQSLVELREVKRIERKDDEGTNTSNFYELPLFEQWYEGIQRNPRGANRPHPSPANRPPGGIPQTRELGIELGSIEEEAAARHVSQINFAIKESHRTGESSDEILRQVRRGERQVVTERPA